MYPADGDKPGESLTNSERSLLPCYNSSQVEVACSGTKHELNRWDRTCELSLPIPGHLGAGQGEKSLWESKGRPVRSRPRWNFSGVIGVLEGHFGTWYDPLGVTQELLSEAPLSCGGASYSWTTGTINVKSKSYIETLLHLLYTSAWIIHHGGNVSSP